MDILLAGVNGHIGSLLHSKLKQKYSITSVDSSNGKIKEHFTKIDLSDMDHVQQYARDCIQFDVLIFLVGLAHAKGKGKDLYEFARINCQTLVNLLSALEDNNKIPHKIIFASTISVYGERYEIQYYNEEAVKKPFSPYAITKLDAEKYLVYKYTDKSWILRFAPVYSSNFMLNINRRTKIGKFFFKAGSGDKKLSLCNIDNIKIAVEGIIDAKVPAGSYNISDSKPYNYNELLIYQGASRILRIPAWTIRLLYALSKMTNNIFLKENSVKLITDNIFPSNKIRSYVVFPSTINGVKVQND